MNKDIQLQNENATLPQKSTEEKIRIIANLLIDRFLEDQNKTVSLSLNINPNKYE